MVRLFRSRELARALGIASIAVGAIAGGIALASPGLTNGRFDSDVSGWTAAGSATLTWSAQDGYAKVNSGAAAVTATGLSEFRSGSGAYQCVPVRPSTRYRLSALAMAPANQQRHVFPGFRIAYHTGAGCTGMPLALDVTNWPENETARWWALGYTVATPPDASYAWIGIMSWAEASTASLRGTTATTLWDDVAFTELPRRLTIAAIAADR